MSAQWDHYAPLFSAITSRFQLQMYERAARHLSGSVIDCGSGAAKLLPYLAAERRVTRYLGVDSSGDMVAFAETMLARYPEVPGEVRREAIEQTRGRFDAAVSLQSHYAWADGGAVLAHIRTLLRRGGTFVLASANDELDAGSLLEVAARELVMYPGWDEYARINQALAEGGGGGRFLSLDGLIAEARAAGFRVREADAALFEGGLNFLVLVA